MPAPVVWSPEQLVNASTLSDQRHSHVTALANGGYVVSWTGYVDPVNSATIGTYFQLYDPFGSKIGTEQLVDGLHSQVEPNVVALPSGGFAIAYQGADEFVTGGVLLATFDADGASLGPAITVNSEIDPISGVSQYNPVMTRLSNGGFAVGYLSEDPDGLAVRVQRFDASGAKDGAEMLVAVDADNVIADLVIGQVGDGSFAVAWTGTDVDFNVYMRIFSDDGDPQTDTFPLGNTANNQFSPAITSDGNSGLVVYVSGAFNEIVGQIYAHDGTVLKAEFPISDGAQNGPSGQYPEVTGLPGGGYFVVWFEYGPGNVPQLVGQVLDDGGDKVGAETVLLTAGVNADAFLGFSVAALADGRVAVTLDAELTGGDDTSGASVHTLIIDPRGGIITGTDAPDLLLGSAGTVADVITALEGDDEVFGLDGDDTIYGNGGNDTIDGGSGADHMEGGSGNDLYHVDSASDVIVEAVGAGIDTVVVQSLDYTLAGGLEVEVLQAAGNGDFDITGNEFGQLLKGDASNNKLLGLGGNDTLDGGTNVDYMEGGTGDDLYLVDHALEFIIEAANGGTDTVQAKGVSFSLITWDYVENLILTGNGNTEGSGNALANTLTGNAFDNSLYGEGGNDTLDGLAGADEMHGGHGDDTFVVSDGADVVGEKPGQGTDTVNASINYTLTAEVENLNLTGAAGLAGTGNALGNVLKGNSAANMLNGLDGNDTLDGLGGGDTLAGGKHDDTYLVGAGDVVVEATNEGFDTVLVEFDYTLTENVEALSLLAGTKATGNAARQRAHR